MVGTKLASGAGIVTWGTYLPYWRLQRAAIAAGARLGAGQGGPRRGLLRRGHHHPGGRGRPAGPRRRARRRPRTCSSPRRPPATSTRPAPPPCTPPSASTATAAPTTSPAPRAPPLGTLLMALSGRAGAPDPGRGRPISAPAWPAEPRSATPATAPSPSSAAPTARWPSSSGGVRPATSSSTAGGFPVRRTRTSGRSASARRCTSRWPARPSPTPSRSAGVTENDVDHAIVAGLHTRAVKAVTAGLGVAAEADRPRPHRRRSAISGRRRPGWPWPTCSSGPVPGQVIVVLSLADGADALVLRTTEALPAAQAARPGGRGADAWPSRWRRAATTFPTRPS